MIKCTGKFSDCCFTRTRCAHNCNSFSGTKFKTEVCNKRLLERAVAKANIFKSEKATDTLLAINHFLIDTYSNYLLYLYNNGEINTCELDYLYLLFITELRQMLDIKLPINKDLLNRNISDNAWIHSERIRRKL